MTCNKDSTSLMKRTSTMILNLSLQICGTQLSLRANMHSLELFQGLQRTYSWMKYYNSELDSRNDKTLDEKVLRELLEDVRKSIIRSLTKLNETGEISNSTEHRQIEKETIDVTSNNIPERIIDREIKSKDWTSD